MTDDAARNMSPPTSVAMPPCPNRSSARRRRRRARLDRHAVPQLRRHQRRRRRLRHAAWCACLSTPACAAVRSASLSGRLAPAPQRGALSRLCLRRAAAKSIAPQPGDVMVLRYGRCYSHGGIVTNAEPADHRARLLSGAARRRGGDRAQRRVGRRDAQAALLQLLGRAVSIFRTGAKQSARTAGLYRPANPDGGQRAAGSDRLGRIQDRAERHLVQQFSIHSRSRAAVAAARAEYSAAAATTTGYTYTASVIMALCEGPIGAINQIWRGQSVYTLAGLGLSLFTGTTPQTEWSYLATAYPVASARLSRHRLCLRGELRSQRFGDAR